MKPLAINRTECVDRLLEQENPLFLSLAKKVLARDNKKCFLCDFSASKMQQVVTKNGCYKDSDFTLDNMVTVCPFCFLGQRLGHAALFDNKITFVYLPEISQPDLNNLQRLMHYYQSHPDIPMIHKKETDMTEQEQGLIDFSTHVEAFLGELEQRVSMVTNAYRHANLHDQKTLVTMLFEMPEDAYEKRMKFFEPIRYLVDTELADELNKIYSKENFVSLNGHVEMLYSRCLNLSSLKA
ncbi:MULTISPECIES: hypothetical protein [Vibrio]|uniref:Type IV secretion protein DotN n=1 Tax=Vibrio tasmaniensis TaxID=212663 RepID=A0A2N7NND5_9VIBR|nr:hypothetical protein [Vibrio tasmaniensis]PMO80332.1 hypothetical protein BCT01_08555 [Vibrio tasmaniensis]PMP17800.1 hypothetical protein BCS92_05175 [Vibrio tasmaniensis]TKG29005.1 hypothetical protein FC057_20175 [Vibrio tasmaniensis]TKG41596.1 hypothetical protein FC063_06975 [Vibrio tasmaniensis]TKG46245.1 hypothetical protein FC070_22440 [Vibrio tasmaniensis]